ncbi:MAG: rRNA maturation RNase YbeY [Bacteroidota bacterium]
MNQDNIHFFSEDIVFDIEAPERISNWIKAVIEAENRSLAHINFIFCSDEYLYQINQEYLNHDTYTDVITFPYASQPIEGDVFISIERIRENAVNYKVDFSEELHRVMVHGTLHLLNYLDKSPEEKAQMTQLENKYLQQLALKEN